MKNGDAWRGTLVVPRALPTQATCRRLGEILLETWIIAKLVKLVFADVKYSPLREQAS